MTLIVGLDDLTKSLIEAGKSLAHSSSTEELLTLLDETESLLRKVEQDPPFSMQCALIPSKNALASVDLLSHSDSDVRVSVVSCLTEIVRISAPQAPYTDDQMKEIFRLTVEAFEKLADLSSRSYAKAESVLDNVSKVKSCLVMLDLECYDLIIQMFHSFLKLIRSDHSRVVFSSMEMIMITIIDEIDEVPADLLIVLLASVKKENQNVSLISRSLAEKVLSRCAFKLKPYIIKALESTRTSLDLYSPVVSTIYHSVSDATKVHNTVNTKENKAAETKLGRQVAPSASLEDKLGLGNSRKEALSKSSSKRPVRDGTVRINVNEKVRNGNTSKLLEQTLKQVRSESTDAETGIGITGKRGRKPNSLMNPDEGYDISSLLKTSSNRKLPKRGESSFGKMTTKRTPLASATTRGLTGSVKQSRVKMDESDSDQDLDSISSRRLKKLASCFRDAESLEKKSQQESSRVPDSDRKIGSSSKKTRSQNGVEKSQRAVKKTPVVEPKIVNSSAKRSSGRSDAKKKMVVDGNSSGEDLVGKRVKIWWPMDRIFYEGIVVSYCSRKKRHQVLYSDGDSEELNLKKERWEFIEDPSTSSEEDEEIDLPESIPLFDIVQRVKKSKNASVSLEPSSSSGVRSLSRTRTKKDFGRKLNKQVERGKGGSKGEAREGKNLKSLKELNAETRRTEEQEVSQDVDHETEDDEDDVSGKQELSGNNGEEDSKMVDTREEEEYYATSEVEGEREDLDSEEEEEPKWRETEDVDEDDDDEAEG